MSMSAIGTKQTSVSALHMSALGSKADMSSRQLLTQTVVKPIAEQVPLLRI